MSEKVPTYFEVECIGETIVVIPDSNFREFTLQQNDAHVKQITQMLDPASCKNVLIDFHKTEYFNSEALAFFVKLWVGVRKCNGCMALCNVSDHEKEILQITKMYTLWPNYSTRSEALDFLKG